MIELCEEMVERLVEEKRHDEAAKILKEKLNRFEDSIATLCQGRLWHQAWTDAQCMKREDLIGNLFYSIKFSLSLFKVKNNESFFFRNSRRTRTFGVR